MVLRCARVYYLCGMPVYEYLSYFDILHTYTYHVGLWIFGFYTDTYFEIIPPLPLPLPLLFFHQKLLEYVCIEYEDRTRV